MSISKLFRRSSAPQKQSMDNRSVIIHFHFFKNAGTSIESILRKNLKERFVTHEPGGPTDAFPASALLPMLSERPGISAVSSHTIYFPNPNHPGYNFFPIVFLRHPLDRMLSMYNFERKQESQQIGATLAKELTIADYLMARRKHKHSFTLRNYQMWMLARERAPRRDKKALFKVAKKEIESLPVVGVVEEFAESVTQYTNWLQPYFPGLDMKPEHQNRSAMSELDMEKRLDFLKDEIGSELFEELLEENAYDIELHRIATERLLNNRIKSTA